MLTDFIDCLFMYSRCEECFAGSPAIELLKATSRLIGFEYLNSSGESSIKNISLSNIKQSLLTLPPLKLSCQIQTILQLKI
jgi:hypothetical protein